MQRSLLKTVIMANPHHNIWFISITASNEQAGMVIRDVDVAGKQVG